MLSDRQIQASIKTCTSETVLNDGAGGKGSGSLVLVIRRRASGSTANWYGQWWADGARQRKPLGPYPSVSLAAARLAYQVQVRDVLAQRKNPRVQVVATERPTVARLFTAYADQMAADGKVSAGEVRRCLGFAAAELGENRLAGEIEPADVSAYLGKLYARGKPVAADRVRSYLSAAFNYGLKAAHDYRQEVRQDWQIKLNPVTAVPKDTSASQPRDRALTRTELAQLWHGMTDDRFALETVAAIRLLICTGQRVLELLRIEAHEVDLVDRVWRMPAEKTKTKVAPHDVPLPDLAVPVLQRLIAKRSRGFLFGDMEHQVINRAISRWLADVDMPHFQTRDLRRTWKSRAADAGVDRFTRDLIQQHAQGDTGSKHYDRADYLPQKRAAMTAWNDYLVRAISPTAAPGTRSAGHTPSTEAGPALAAAGN